MLFQIGGRNGFSAAEDDFLRRNVLAINGFVGVIVRSNRGAFERNAGEYAARSRVAQDFGAGGDVGLGRGVARTGPGGPADSTLVLGLLVLRYGFQYFRMGDASAISVVMFAIILTVTAIQLWFNRRVA